MQTNIYIYARTDLSLVLFCSLSFALARAAWHFRNLKTAIILYVVNNVWIWIKWIQNWNNILLCCNKRGFFFFFSLSCFGHTIICIWWRGEEKIYQIISLITLTIYIFIANNKFNAAVRSVHGISACIDSYSYMQFRYLFYCLKIIKFNMFSMHGNAILTKWIVGYPMQSGRLLLWTSTSIFVLFIRPYHWMAVYDGR